MSHRHVLRVGSNSPPHLATRFPSMELTDHQFNKLVKLKYLHF